MKDRLTQLLFAIGGAVLVFVGTFAPSADAGILGVYSYWELGLPEMYVLLAACALVIVTVIQNMKWWMRFFIVVALVAPFSSLIIEPYKEKSTFDKIGETLAAPIKNVIIDCVDYSWGGFTLIGGLLMLLVVLILSFKKLEEKKKKTMKVKL